MFGKGWPLNNTAKDIVGETKVVMPKNKKPWWDEEILRVVACQKNEFKLWLKSRKRKH